MRRVSMSLRCEGFETRENMETSRSPFRALIAIRKQQVRLLFHNRNVTTWLTLSLNDDGEVFRIKGETGRL